MPDRIMEDYDGIKVYKYYSYNNCMKTMFAPVIKMTLRYTNPNLFNDPYDCYITAELKAKTESVRSHHMSEICVCCLTASFDNMLMWSHYASHHQGFVVEYDVKQLNKINYPQTECFAKVIYSDDIPIYDFLTNNLAQEESIVKAIYHKPKCWEYESEIRSVVYNGGGINGYVDIPLNNSCITGIFLGSLFMQKRKGKIPLFLKTWHENGKLYYMQLLSDKYQLEKRNDFLDEWFE